MNQQPDSQRTPFGPNQLAWLKEKYGAANFRYPEQGSMVKCKCGEKR